MSATQHRPIAYILLAHAIAGVLFAQQQPDATPGTSAPTAPVTLRIATADGKPRACTVDLARFDREDLPLRSLPAKDGFQVRKLTPADLREGIVTLRDLPRGHFVFVITMDDHAIAFSQPLLVSSKPAELTVQLTLGATLHGLIQDEDGKPLAGATITSGPAQTLDTKDSAQGLSTFPVPRTSQVKATSDAQGRFELPHLAAGEYTIRTGHTDWCPTQLDLSLTKDGERRGLGIVRLQRGTTVTGRVADARSRKFELHVDIPVKPAGNANAPPKAHYTAYTQADGTFRFAQRLPPGRYLLTAKAQQESGFGGSSFGDFEAQLEVVAGQGELFLPLQAR